MPKAQKQPGSPVKFRAIIHLSGKTATGIQVPPDVVRSLGPGKRPPVRVTLKGYTYRSTVAVFGDEFWIGVSAEVREQAGVAAGDTVDVMLELDTEPREVVVPPDFKAALDRDTVARGRFNALSYSHKRRHVLAIEAAKTPETRQRRVARALDMLRQGK